MSRFVDDVKSARRNGDLQERFRSADVKYACPGWADRTYTNFLPKHRIGNPGGYAPYFVQHGDGTYSLADD